MRLSNAPGFAGDLKLIDPRTLKIPKAQLRKHPPSKIERIKGSVIQHGFYLPVIVGPDLTLVTGSARVRAAIDLGLGAIPIIERADLTDAQVRAIRIADNKLQEGSQWDEALLAPELKDLSLFGLDLSALGFVDAEIDKYLSSDIDALTEESDPHESGGDAVTQAGDIWTIGKHRIICGDCLSSQTLQRLLNGEQAAVCVTDPPYNKPINGHVLTKGDHEEFAMASGEMLPGEFQTFLDDATDIAGQTLRPGGLAYLFMDWGGIDQVVRAGKTAGLDHLNICVWVKTNAGMGSFYRSQHELISVFRKPGRPATNNIQLGKHGRNRSNVWNAAGMNTFTPTRQEDLADHPTVKPVGLIEDILKDCTRRGDIVLDLFGGSGTTMLAAERCERSARLIEISPRYVDVTIRRMQRTFGVDAIHEESALSFDALAAQRQPKP